MNADSNARDKLLNDLSSTLAPASEPISDTPLAPPVIPDHELFRRIGRGSYGEVWLARNVMGTWRAVKIVQRAAFDHDRPYEREFEGIRRFEPVSRTHPSQLNVLHVGRNDAAGHFYYVMELADDIGGTPTGGTSSVSPQSHSPESWPRVTRPSEAIAALQPSTYSPRTLRSDLHHRGRLPSDECLRIGLALATALDHLHRHGLVHRDIKPSNIVFVNGIPKLADIGLVARAEATLSLVGTEGYLPPEGSGKPQADIFSLGKVLYEMATGRDRQEYPELPTNLIQQPAAERAQLAELNEIIVSACHADLKQRYQTAAELHADLALLQSGKSVSRMRTVERRLRFLGRAGALVTGVALLTGAALLYQQHQTREARRLAQANLDLAEEKAALATEKTRLADNLTKLGEENRQRIVRLDIANGIHLLDEGDPSGALLWFADALPLLTNTPAEEAIHRIRNQQTLDQTPRVLRLLPHGSGVESSAFSLDGGFIATGTKDGNLRVWNAAEGKLVWGPRRMEAVPIFLRFSRDGKRLFVSSSGEQWMFNGASSAPKFFAVLDAQSGRKLFPAGETWTGMATNLICSHFSPDDRWLAVSQNDNVIRVFDLRDGRQVTEIRGHTDEVRFLSFSADGSLLASASLDKTVRVWSLPSGEPAAPPLEHRWPVVRVLLTDDGKHLITGSFAKPGASGPGEDGTSEVQAWDVPNSRRLGDPIPTGGWVVMFVAPGQQGRFFVQGRKSIQGYNFESITEPVARLDMSALHSWDFSKDGSRLALGGGDYLARVFDAGTAAPLTEPLRHGNWGVVAVQFSPDERQLLTASNDGNARLWDLRPSPAESSHLKLPAPIKLVHTKNLSRQLGRSPGGMPINLGDGTVRIISDQLQELHRFSSDESGKEIESPTSATHSNIWALQRYDVGSDSRTEIVLWRQVGEKVRQFTLKHPDWIFEDTFTPDDRYLVTSCRDRRVRFWRTSDGELERTIEVPKPEDGEMRELSPDGQTAVWLQLASILYAAIG